MSAAGLKWEGVFLAPILQSQHKNAGTNLQPNGSHWLPGVKKEPVVFTDSLMSAAGFEPSTEWLPLGCQA